MSLCPQYKQIFSLSFPFLCPISLLAREGFRGLRGKNLITCWWWWWLPFYLFLFLFIPFSAPNNPFGGFLFFFFFFFCALLSQYLEQAVIIIHTSTFFLFATARVLSVSPLLHTYIRLRFGVGSMEVEQGKARSSCHIGLRGCSSRGRLFLFNFS